MYRIEIFSVDGSILIPLFYPTQADFPGTQNSQKNKIK